MTLIEKLKKLKEFTEQTANWEWYKKKWTESIDDLYNKITNDFLEDFIKEGVVSFEKIPVVHSDPFIGEYSTHILDINFFPNRTIRIVPVTGITTEYDGKLDFYMLGDIADRIGISRELNPDGKVNWKIISSSSKNGVKPFTKNQFEKSIEKWLP